MRVWVLLAVLGLFGCRPEVSRASITVLLESSPDSLDNRLALTANGQRVAQLIAPGLVTFDDRSQPVPDLANSFDQLDPLTLQFRLRPGLRFHDGSPLTSADVKATYDALLDRSFPSPKADKLAAIASVEAVDELTVRFHLKRPYAPLLAELSISVVPRARARGPLAALQDRAPIGAGPFRFVSQADEEHLELEAFAGYFGGAPQVPRVSIRVVRDETTRVLELLKGRADLTLNTITPAVLPMLKDSPNLRVLTAPGSGYAYLAFNVRAGPLADPRVRRALCHLIDVKPIVEHKFHGLARAATGMLPVTHWAYAPTPGCRFDPAEAARLLDEAGYPARPGAPRLKLSYKTSTDRFRKSIALVFKEQLEQGGVEVDLRALEFGTLFNDLRKGNFELITLKWAAVIEPDLLRDVFASDQVPTPANNFGGLNRGGYRNPALDALLQRAAAALPADRAALYAAALTLIDQDLPYAPLWHEDAVAVVSRRLADYRVSPHGFLQPLAQAREVAP